MATETNSHAAESISDAPQCEVHTVNTADRTASLTTLATCPIIDRKTGCVDL